MDDFLGTSIQYSERQILLLEEQHEADLQKTVQELIESGFLDSDCEEPSESELEEPTEFTTLPAQKHIDEEGPHTQVDDMAMALQSNFKVSTVSEAENVQPSESDFLKIHSFKSLILLFMLMVAVPPILDHDPQTKSIYAGGVPLKHQMIRQTVYWFHEPQKENEECPPPQTINFDIMTINADTTMNMRYQLKIKSSDLTCDDGNVLLHIGAALKSPQINRIVTATVSRSVGRQIVRTQHLTAFIMSLVVITALFALSNTNIDEYSAVHSS